MKESRRRVAYPKPKNVKVWFTSNEEWQQFIQEMLQKHPKKKEVNSI